MTCRVVMVGDGPRARAWSEALRAQGAEVVAVVARGEQAAGRYPMAALDEVLGAFPQARFAVALPPRASTAVALHLARAQRSALVQAPLDASLLAAQLPDGASKVRVALGFLTLGGCSPFERLLRDSPARRLSIEVRGMPEAHDGDLREALFHALALVRRLSADVRVERAELTGETQIDVAFDGALAVTLQVRARGQGLVVHGDWSWGSARWSWRPDEERLTLSRAGKAPGDKAQVPRGGALRAVGQLLFDSGASLHDAAHVLRLERDIAGGVGTMPLPGRPFRQAVSLAERRPADLLAQLGLEPIEERPAAPAGTVPRLPQLSDDVPAELWTFRAGLAPVVFLTLSPSEVERTLNLFGAVHVERRERRVAIGALDTWIDKRDVGEPRVELYLSRDPSLARRAAEIQASGDPSSGLVEMGGLLGYPPCCVAAFAARSDRANNTATRYATAGRTPGAEPWSWRLNNLFTLIVPFYPCSYRCAAAERIAERAFEQRRAAGQREADRLRSFLARPVLYFAHERFLVLDGAVENNSVRFTSAALPQFVDAAFEVFAQPFAAGGRLEIAPDTLQLSGPDGERLGHWSRTEPSLGMLAPFAESTRDDAPQAASAKPDPR